MPCPSKSLRTAGVNENAARTLLAIQKVGEANLGILLDFGFGYAAQKRVAECLARRDWDRLSRALSTIFFFYLGAALVIGLLGVMSAAVPGMGILVSIAIFALIIGFIYAMLRLSLVLMSSKASTALPAFAFRPYDVILMGSESSGAPPEVHAAADARLVIPIRPQTRSLNLAVTCALALGEALRQVDGFPN